jgi:flavin-dependent dehydrogenase
VGAGPAGIAAAIRLAAAGQRVMISAPQAGSSRLESAPPSLLPLLDLLEVRSAAEADGSLRERRTLVRWGGRDRANLDGYILDRQRFDQTLLSAARRAGAAILPRGRVESPSLSVGMWSVRVAGQSVSARYLVDATGRRGWLPGRRIRLAPPLIAHWARGRGTWANAEMIVEAGPRQWYWAVKQPDGHAVAAVLFDPADRLAFANDNFQGRLSHSSLLGANCFEAEGMTQICSAAPQVAAHPIGDGWLKSGEAAIAFDPLSGQGVAMALSNGIAGAAVAHTILRAPEYTSLAQSYYRDRIAASADDHRRHLGSFYAEQASVSEDRFWKDRANLELAHPTARAQSAILPSDDHRRLQLNRLARVRDVAALDGDFIRPRTAVSMPHTNRAIAFLDGVEIGQLLPLLADYPVAGQLKARLVSKYGKRGSDLFAQLTASEIVRPV